MKSSARDGTSAAREAPVLPCGCGVASGHIFLGAYGATSCRVSTKVSEAGSSSGPQSRFRHCPRLVGCCSKPWRWRVWGALPGWRPAAPRSIANRATQMPAGGVWQHPLSATARHPLTAALGPARCLSLSFVFYIPAINNRIKLILDRCCCAVNKPRLTKQTSRNSSSTQEQ
jgi:hypothetical protein